MKVDDTELFWYNTSFSNSFLSTFLFSFLSFYLKIKVPHLEILELNRWLRNTTSSGKNAYTSQTYNVQVKIEPVKKSP